MKRSASVLAVLLVGTNAVWLWHEMSRDVPATPPDAAPEDEIARRDATIAKLSTELADARTRLAATPPAPEAPRPGRASPPAVAPAPPPPVPVKPVALDTSRANSKADSWRSVLLQTGDPAKRDATWNEVREAMRSDGDRETVLAALRAIVGTSAAKLDRTGLREDVLLHVDAPELTVRLAAWQALLAAGVQPEDVPRVRRFAEETLAEARGEGVIRFNWAVKGDFTGDNAATVVKLLADPAHRKDVVRGLQSASKMDDAVAAALLEYARSGSEAADHTIHFVLRTLRDKPRAVVEFLLDRAAKDFNAAEGLRWGVRPEDSAYAAGRLMQLYEAREPLYIRTSLLGTLGSIGDPACRDWLAKIRDDDTADATLRNAAKNALAQMDRPRR